MKITSEQIKKINDKCSNGWQLDVRHAIICSEKQLVLQAQRAKPRLCAALSGGMRSTRTSAPSARFRSSIWPCITPNRAAT